MSDQTEESVEPAKDKRGGRPKGAKTTFVTDVRLEEATTERLVSLGDADRVLGYCRQYHNEMRKRHANFPQPVARVGHMQVYRLSDIEAWHEGRADTELRYTPHATRKGRSERLGIDDSTPRDTQ